jgi:hypothetical protein
MDKDTGLNLDKELFTINLRGDDDFSRCIIDHRSDQDPHPYLVDVSHPAVCRMPSSSSSMDGRITGTMG